MTNKYWTYMKVLVEPPKKWWYNTRIYIGREHITPVKVVDGWPEGTPSVHEEVESALASISHEDSEKMAHPQGYYHGNEDQIRHAIGILARVVVNDVDGDPDGAHSLSSGWVARVLDAAQALLMMDPDRFEEEFQTTPHSGTDEDPYDVCPMAD